MLIIKRSKTTSITSVLKDDVIITGPDDIANSMNKYYFSIGEQLSNKIPNKSNTFIKESLPSVRAAFRFLDLAQQQLIKTLSKFKISRGFGVDNISSFFLKKGMPILANSLSQIVELSINIGQFLDSRKVERVSPMYKDGQTDDRSKYRPISVMPAVARLFEMLVLNSFTLILMKTIYFSLASQKFDLTTPY